MICEFIKDNGGNCKANAMIGSKFCYLHNPDISDEEKREAQIRGGKVKMITIKKALPELALDHSGDIFYLIADTIKRVRTGELDPRLANTIFYGSGALIRAYELKDIEKRIEDLEKAVKLK
jgi:hypothetical protein